MLSRQKENNLGQEQDKRNPNPRRSRPAAVRLELNAPDEGSRFGRRMQAKQQATIGNRRHVEPIFTESGTAGKSHRVTTVYRYPK